jgi:hypothetical protein
VTVLPTVKLRHKRTGATRIVNQTAYAANLGAWDNWTIISMRGGNATDAEVLFAKQQEDIERTRERNPKSPAFGDAQRSYEARAITTLTNAPEAPTDAVEHTTATEVVAPVEPPSVTREVPVIGGAQVVKMRGRPPNKKPPSEEVL